MTDPALRRSFIALHLTLVLVIIIESTRTLVHAFGALVEHHHMGLLGSVELVAAPLFLVPRTMRVGGLALVTVLLLAVLGHALRGEFAAAPLVYAAAALFVTVHGSAWRGGESQAAA
jgi:hypothetical protein